MQELEKEITLIESSEAARRLKTEENADIINIKKSIVKLVEQMIRDKTWVAHLPKIPFKYKNHIYEWIKIKGYEIKNYSDQRDNADYDTIGIKG